MLALPALCGVTGTSSNPKLVTIDTQCYGREVASEAKAPMRDAADLLSPLRSHVAPLVGRSRLGRCLSPGRRAE
jgi:hypothetical protein